MKRTRFGALLWLVVFSLLLASCGAEPTATPATGSGTGTDAGATMTANTPEAQATEATGSTDATKAPEATKADGSTKTDPNSVVRIGLAFVTSGANAVYGTSQRKAAEMAWKEIDAAGGINGHKIAATFEDTAAKPDQAISVFQKLINVDKVLAIIGPTLSNEAKSSDEEAQREGVPVLAVSNTAAGITEIGDYIFRDSLAESQVIPETIKQAKEKLNLTKVSILYAKDDAFSKSGFDVFKAELEKNNIQILSEQTFATTDTDYKAQLTAIKGDNPDAIVVSALAQPAQTILQQARNDVGIDPEVHIIGGNGFNSPAVLKAAGASAEGLIVGAAWNISNADEMNRKFIEDFKAMYGAEPDQFAAQAYAGFHILADAIKRANITDFGPDALQQNRANIRDALKATRDFPTVLGNFSFTDKRDANHPPVVQIVKDGKFDVLK